MAVAASYKESANQYGFTLAIQVFTLILTIAARPYKQMLQNIISIVGDLLVLIIYILLKLSQDEFEIFSGKVISSSTAID